VQDRLELVFEELGALDLKNIARPVEAFVLRPDDNSVVTVGLEDNSREQGIGDAVGRSDRTSVIVLPFENLTDEGGEEIILADGITEDLTTDLARIPGVYVVARSRAFSYKGRAIDLTAIGRHLSVRFALRGSVRRVGAHIRVNAQLVDVRAGGYVWVDRFDTDPAGTADVQNEITGRLMRALRRALVAEEERLIANKHLNDLNTKELVLRGKATATWPISRETYQAARDCYERALALDPKVFDAQVGLAGTLLANAADGWSLTPEKDYARAEQLIAAATSQDSNRAAARLVRGFLRRLQKRLAETQIDLEDAISLEPENPTAHSQLGYTLICLGEPDTAIAEIEKGMRLGPQEPLIPVCYFMLGLSYLLLHDTDRSIELFRRACAANARLYYVYLGLAAAFGLKEDLDDARAALSEAIRLRPDIETLTLFRARHPWTTHPRHMALAEETVFLGLLRAGMSN
jgi:TolB-like protein/tetratricopeptide (TPR) repeat protein